MSATQPDRLQHLQRPRTCNEAAAQLFPQVAKHCTAFLEHETVSLNELSRLQLLDLNDDFWALTLNGAVYVKEENQFRQYTPDSGVYEPVQESTLTGQLITNLNLCAQSFPSSLDFQTFLSLKNRVRLKSVVDRAKDMLEVNNEYFKDRHPHFLNLANGILNLGTGTFTPFSPDHPVRHTVPIKYDPEAKCEMFLKSFLAHILSPDDIDLLQRYCSQILLGHNHSQTILVLTGDAGWGKSTLMRILGQIIGWHRVGIIRHQLYTDDSELSHYADKHLLYHPDMPTQFLNHTESSIFKQLVGGDPIWCDVKGQDERVVIEGNFPVILACNGKPQIQLDQDADAWLRRLVVLSFKKPAHENHLGKMGELLFRNEASGVLNWLLEGGSKLIKTSLQLTQTQDQQTRAATLLMASDSPRAFVRAALVKKKEGVVGAVEMYENYQTWCREHHLPPFASKPFHQIAKAELEISFGLKYRHDLESGNGKAMRGWRGLALHGTGDIEKAKNASEESVAKVLEAGALEA